MHVINALKKNNVKVWGNQESTQTIVFGHGFGCDHTAWRFVQKAFEQDYRLVTYDNIGAGMSDSEYYDQERYTALISYANDLIDICDEMEIQDAVFVGHSVSGMIGVLASLQIPEFFQKHVLMNASPRYLNDASVGYIGGFDQSDLDALFQAMANNYHSWVSGFAPMAMRNPQKPELAQEFAHTLASVRPDIALAVSKAIFESDRRKEVKGFPKETLIIQSRNDIAVPMDVAFYLNGQIPNSRLVKIDAEGHFPHISAPQEVVRALQSFL